MTTVGLTFRLWCVDREDLELRPFTFGDVVVDRYIHADSDDAWVMHEFVRSVKNQVPLRNAPVLPSQAHLLSAASGDEFGESSMQGQDDTPMSLLHDPTAEQMEEAEYDEDAEVAAVAGPSAPVAEGSATKWVKTRVDRIRHVTRHDEYIFTTMRGHSRSTDKDEWTETMVKGQKAWYYLHKGTYYYTREKPGS